MRLFSTEWIGSAPNNGNKYAALVPDLVYRNVKLVCTASECEDGPPEPSISYELTTNAVNGSITANPNRSSYPEGMTAFVRAVPDTGYRFIGWSGDASGNQNPLELTFDQNKNIIAQFVAIPNQYTVVVDQGEGRVVRFPDKVFFEEGEQLTLTAQEVPGFRFTSWSGDISRTEKELNLSVTADLNITANYESVITDPGAQYALKLYSFNGDVVITPEKDSYDAGELVTVFSIPDDGYVFKNWCGSEDSKQNPYTFVMDQDKIISPTILRKASVSNERYALQVQSSNGQVQIFPEQDSYESGTNVVLTAIPEDGYVFARWSW